MDETGLEKIINKISENKELIKSLSKLAKKAGAPKKEIQAVLDWIKQRQKTLTHRYSARIAELCEEADTIAYSYQIGE